MKKLAILLLVLAPAAQAADIDVVRQNMLAYYTAAGAARTSSRMQQSLGELEWYVRTNTEPGFFLSDGSWTDINYSDTPDGSWSPWDHVRRTFMMAKAYRTPGTSLYGDAQLLVHIEAALRKTHEFYGSALPLGNWWFWTVGVPLDLGPTLVLMRGEITQDTYDRLVNAIAVRIGSSPTSRGVVGPVPTGQNLVWSSFTHLCLALLKDDPVMLGRVRDAMTTVVVPSLGEGVKSDASFHQHGAQLYTGGYGGSFANDVGKFMLLTRGTSFALPVASVASVADFMADGIAWSLYGNYFDVSTISREVARSSTTGFNGIAALLQSSQFESPRANEIRSAAARMLQSWQWGLPTELAGLAAIIERGGYEAAWPSGHRHYYESDFTIHRRPRWYASIKMFSTRTKSGENTNGENALGARQSDGRMYLSLSGSEYNEGNVWPSLDWSRLPGTTVEQHAATAGNTFGFGTRSFVGGTGDGRNGVSAMDLTPVGSQLRAKKSWFFFDDAIVFLTNSITSSSGHRVETVVNQWPVSSSASQTSSGPGWSVVDGIGYYFPTGGNVQTNRQARSGAWALLGASGDETAHSNTFWTMWIDHGAYPVNATAEYVIVPDTNAAAMRTWVATNPISIVANNGSVSAVRRDDTLGIVFWTATNIEGVQTTAPAIVYITESGSRLTLSASDPTNGKGSFFITIPGKFNGPNVTHPTSRSTMIEVPRNGGRTFTVTLERAITRRRAVR